MDNLLCYVQPGTCISEKLCHFYNIVTFTFLDSIRLPYVCKRRTKMWMKRQRNSLHKAEKYVTFLFLKRPRKISPRVLYRLFISPSQKNKICHAKFFIPFLGDLEKRIVPGPGGLFNFIESIISATLDLWKTFQFSMSSKKDQFYTLWHLVP